MFSLPNQAVIVMLNYYRFRRCDAWYIEGEPPSTKIVGGDNIISRERALGIIEATAAFRGETVDKDHPALVDLEMNDPPRFGSTTPR
jgi:hypothetical protein